MLPDSLKYKATLSLGELRRKPSRGANKEKERGNDG